MTTSAPVDVSLATGMDMLRVSGNGQCYGRLMLKPRPGSKPSLQARLVAVSLAAHARALCSSAEPSYSRALTTRSLPPVTVRLFPMGLFPSPLPLSG
jgi:hypothetical protein